jgi:hypothetical protein
MKRGNRSGRGRACAFERSLLCTITIAIVFATGGAAPAQDDYDEGRVIRDAELSPPVTPFVFDGDVRDLPTPPQWQPGDPVKEIPRRLYPPPGEGGPPAGDPGPFMDLLHEAQRFAPDNTNRGFTEPSRNFPGQGYTGVNPPDTVGDVGPNHYIQSINAGGGAVVRIYDKAEPVPNTLATFYMDNMGSSYCDSGYGDPIVLYDRLADRWLLSEFSSSGSRLCVYISQTGDPVSGGWYNYAYAAPSFPDYPKYAVWPTDANGGQGSYVITANDGGPGIYALDRGGMLAGTEGSFQRLTIPRLPGFPFQAPTPADLDGPVPPAPTAPAIIMRHRDTEVHDGPSASEDLLEMWYFDVDWTTPSNTMLVEQPSIDVAEFDSTLCGLSSFWCFPQPGTSTKLDPLREVIMYRLQYMSHDEHESLLGNFVVDVDGNNHGGVRWFELRRQGAGSWILYQEGTYAIDSEHRWMAASSMDQSTNIAVAYSVSSDTTYPSLRYTGRRLNDPLGVMTQAETSIHAGTASNSSNRWGDYAAMNLDPVDDCTFWFTSLDNTSSNWRTQIVSFAFDVCGCPRDPSVPTASATPAGDNRIDVHWDDSDLDTIVEYELLRSLNPGGPYDTLVIVPDTSPGTANGPDYTYSDTDVSGGTTYYYTVVSTDGVTCTSDASQEVQATATGLCTFPPTFGGLQDVTPSFEATCKLDLSWDEATTVCDTPLAYNIYRSLDPATDPGPSTLLASGYPGTSYRDVFELLTDTPYYYVVRAVDVVSGVEENNLVEVSGIPKGTFASAMWADDAGDSGEAKMITESPWFVNPTEGYLEPAVYKTGAYTGNLCSGLETPELKLGSGSVLTFASKYSIESGWDKGEVQISTDGGSVWERVEMDYPGSSSQASDACGLPPGDYFTGAAPFYAFHVADLTPWNDEFVKIRFALSTNDSGIGSGWWVDDIDITNVDVPGSCVTGSTCADNPYVNVIPEGPFATCEGQAETLTAVLTGGNGPFSYQWTRDGIDIAGADSSTLVVNDGGTHLYNVKVRAQACAEEMTDGNSTQITWTDAPDFDGIASATNAELPTCTVDLAWAPASTVCAGPISYAVYRSTTSPVAVTPANRIAWGLTDTTYADSVGLTGGVTYHYLVRAVEESTGQADTNTIEASATPTGQGGSSCATAQPLPPPVPDGEGNTTPLMGSRGTVGGDVIDLTWDAASCPAAVYNLLFGDLADVSSYGLSGARCWLGTTGSYAWSGVPAGNLYFLIVGSDGQGTESSWGTDSSHNERNGPTASFRCLVSNKDTTLTCP